MSCNFGRFRFFGVLWVLANLNNISKEIDLLVLECTLNLYSCNILVWVSDCLFVCLYPINVKTAEPIIKTQGSCINRYYKEATQKYLSPFSYNKPNIKTC